MADTTTPKDKILAIIKAKYKDNQGKALSIEHILLPHEFALVCTELYSQYPSIQTNYNVGANDNKIQLTLGYV